VLGKVIQTLCDRPTLEDSDLARTLAASGDVVRVVFNPVLLTEVALVWQALEIPYMLCVSYMMRVMLLQSGDGVIEDRFGAAEGTPPESAGQD
jgi:hypothetical protein